LLTAFLAAGLSLSTTGLVPAQAAQTDALATLQLPPGWTLVPTSTGPELRWRSPERLPWGDATLEVRLEGRPLAPATLRRDQRTVAARVTPKQLSTLVSTEPPDLAVWSGGLPIAGAPEVGATRLRTSQPPLLRTVRRASDPGAAGRFDVAVTSYRRPNRAILDLPEPVEVLGQVVAPVDAEGARPLVVLLHGRHETCYRPETGRLSVAWPCPDGTEAVPSHRGFTYLQRHLASRGFVTVSISANGINAQDIPTEDGGTAARSVLVRRHLNLWSQWAAPGGPWEGRVDLQKVLLIGHSRGGEGVQRVAIDADTSAPWRVRGTVALAPTAALRQTPAFTPTTTLLPTCDGDVVSLDGQVYVDRPRDVTDDPAFRSAITVVGGNHNFFNTEWTPGLATANARDDAIRRPECRADSPTRIAAAEQRQVAKTYVAASAEALLREAPTALRMLDGTGVTAPSTAGLDVRVAALGGNRTTVRPGLDGRVTGSDGASLCDGRTGAGDADLCGRGRDPIMTPHWPSAWWGPSIPAAPAMELRWTGGQGRALVSLRRSLDLTEHRAVEARVALDPEYGSVDLALRLVDGAGRVLTLETPRLRPLPGGQDGGQVWGQTLRAQLPQVGRFDASNIRAVGVVARSDRGRVWVLDLSGYRPGLSVLPDVRLPRLDVPIVETPEGDGAGVARLPLVLDTAPDVTAVASLEVLAPDGETSVQQVRFEPGDTREVLRFPFEGDTRDDVDRRAWSVKAYAVKNLVVRSPFGRAVVVDDDPAPVVSVIPLADDVTEEDALRWRIELSAPADYGYVVVASAVPDPADGAELDSADVPRRWLRRQAPVPDSPVPLHELGLQLVLFLPEQTTTASLRIPTVADSLTEGAEWLRLEMSDELGNPVGTPVSGRVTDG
jgi:hypothetical protein